jgi:hypothetical protein
MKKLHCFFQFGYNSIIPVIKVITLSSRDESDHDTTNRPAIIHKLVETFEQNLDSYHSSKNETELRCEFLDKFSVAL